MDVTLVPSPVGDSSKKSQKRRKRRSKKQAVGNTGAEIRDQIDESLEASDKITDYRVSDNELRKNPLETDLTVQPLADDPKVDAGSVENLSEGNANRKKKKRLRKKKKATISDELHSIDGTKMDTGSTENLTEGTVTAKRKKKRKSIKKAESKDEVQSMDQAEIDTGSTENFAEGNVTTKRKRKQKRSKKAKSKDEVQSMSQAGSTPFLHLSDENHEQIDDVVEVSCYNTSSGLAKERGAESARPVELEGKPFPCESQLISHPNRMGRENEEFENRLTEVNNEIVLDQGKGSAEGRNVLCTCNVEATHFASCDVKDADCLCSKMAPTISIRRKLLVLDVNGLLADIVNPAPKHCRGDIRMFGRASESQMLPFELEKNHDIYASQLLG